MGGVRVRMEVGIRSRRKGEEEGERREEVSEGEATRRPSRGSQICWDIFSSLTYLEKRAVALLSGSPSLASTGIRSDRAEQGKSRSSHVDISEIALPLASTNEISRLDSTRSSFPQPRRTTRS